MTWTVASPVARLVHVSNDAIFSGSQGDLRRGGYAGPHHRLWRCKGCGETKIKATLPSAAIARTSLIIGKGLSPRETRCPAHVAGADAMSRYELGVLRATSNIPGPTEVRLNCSRTQARLTTRLRGACEFLGREWDDSACLLVVSRCRKAVLVAQAILLLLKRDAADLDRARQ